MRRPAGTASGPNSDGYDGRIQEHLGPRQRVPPIHGRQVVTEPADRRDDVRHQGSDHIEARLDHGRVEAGHAVARSTLARQPLDLAPLGGRLARVRAVHELIADQVRHLASSPTGLLPLRIARRVGGGSDPGHGAGRACPFPDRPDGAVGAGVARSGPVRRAYADGCSSRA